MFPKKNKTLTHSFISRIRFAFLITSLVMLAGCAVGRSWDTYTYYKEPKGLTLPNLTGLTLYIDGDISIVEKALSRAPKQEIGNFKIREKGEKDTNIYPVVKVRFDPHANYLYNALGLPLGLTYLISGFSFSIVPGYIYEPSEAHFQLTLPDKSGLPITKDFSYARKRHTFTWFPFIFGYNFVQTVQVFTEPEPSRSQLQEELVRQFFRDSKQSFDAYRASQGMQESTSQRYGVSTNFLAGNTVMPVKNAEIQMVSEDVKITSDGSVSVLYVFKNLSNTDVQFRMGFPLLNEADRSFKVWVANQYEWFKKGTFVIDKKELSKDFSGDDLNMFYWDMSFAAKEKKEVRVEYASEWGVGWPYDQVVREFRYIIKTGSLWSGAIEKADFSLTLPEHISRLLRGLGRYEIVIKPPNYLKKDNVIEWHFTDWKPKEDIQVWVSEKEPTDKSVLEDLARYYNLKDYFGDKGLYKVEDFYELHLDRQPIYLKFDKQNRLQARALRNEIFARHGKIFTTSEMKQIFESARWYKPRSEFNEQELNEIERKNVQFIDEYEKDKGWE